MPRRPAPLNEHLVRQADLDVDFSLQNGKETCVVDVWVYELFTLDGTFIATVSDLDIGKSKKLRLTGEKTNRGMPSN